MSLNVTRCPNCRSTFNISRRQLESSGGLARCGACLRVFPAADNLIESTGDTDSAESVFIGRAPEEYFNPDSFVNQSRNNGEQESAVARGDPNPAGAMQASPAADAKSPDEEPLELPEFKEQFEILPEDGREAIKQANPALELQSGTNFNWGAFVGQTTLALMLLTALAAQYLWRHLPVYSQVDWLRPGYARICARAGCELPVYSRVSQIRNDNTALRTHPDYPNAYLLAAQFHNAAPFPQPFPVLVLRFSSLDARTVAMREFAPAEYLHPDLLALELMPPNSPVQVELEVINPGPRAVSYEISFKAPHSE